MLPVVFFVCLKNVYQVLPYETCEVRSVQNTEFRTPQPQLSTKFSFPSSASPPVNPQCSLDVCVRGGAKTETICPNCHLVAPVKQFLELLGGVGPKQQDAPCTVNTVFMSLPPFLGRKGLRRWSLREGSTRRLRTDLNSRLFLAGAGLATC